MNHATPTPSAHACTTLPPGNPPTTAAATDGSPKEPHTAPPKTFEGLPLASCPLSIEERARWIGVLDPLLKYAGRPGDWGRESKLGQLTMRLMQVRAEMLDASTLPKEGGAA